MKLLGTTQPSSLLLRKANGTIVKSLGRWEGGIEVEGMRVQGSFEVFDSRGAWEFLLGKRLKNALKAIHDYNTDEVTIKGVGNQTTLKNQCHTVETRKQQTQQATTPTCLVTDEDQQDEESSEVNVEITQGDAGILPARWTHSSQKE